MRIIFIILMAFVLLWTAAFGWFLRDIRGKADLFDIPRTDAIIMLTGGSERLQTAAELLQMDKADKLLISGVGNGVRVHELTPYIRATLDADKIILGDMATNTAQNAEEIARWVEQYGLESFILVTSNYHMPRAFLEVSRLSPDVEIYAYPVHSGHVQLDGWWKFDGTRDLLLAEFHKWLLVLAGLREPAKQADAWLRSVL